MSGRRLTDDERALWQGVTGSVAPLRKRLRREPETTAPASKAVKSRVAPTATARPTGTAPPPKSAAPPSLAPLGRRLKQRIARGRHEIDGRLDLHGMTQAEAHGALLGFLRSRQARGARFVLVITGKGGGDRLDERGVLKRQVPLWLQLPEFRTLVVGFESAGIGHGGEGALYVNLRKPR
jgi:DNA-nicking Smr family endonuclease